MKVIGIARLASVTFARENTDSPTRFANEREAACLHRFSARRTWRGSTDRIARIWRQPVQRQRLPLGA